MTEITLNIIWLGGVKNKEIKMTRETRVVSIKKDLKSVSEDLFTGLQEAAQKIADKALDKILKPIEVRINEVEKVEVEGAAHPKLQEIIKVLSNRMPVFLVGEAGSGKTHMVEQAAQGLKLPFYCMSVCGQTTASSLLGYMNATGQYVRTLFREAYENGGVFLLDEIDNGNPNVLSVLNSALSNNVCSFPDKMVERHKDFVLCASGNTYGHGANRKYVGRLEIDGATLDRFVFIEIEYSKPLEKQICGWPKYAELIQVLRDKAKQLGMRHIISPRASIYGVKLVKSGVSLDDALKYTVFKDMTEDEINKLFEENETKQLFNQLKAKADEMKPDNEDGEENDEQQEEGQQDNKQAGDNQESSGTNGTGESDGKAPGDGGLFEIATDDIKEI